MLPATTKRLLATLQPSNVRSRDFDVFFECLESYETLADIGAIASYEPTGLLQTPRIRYLLFALEAHLNEFYMFTERAQRWLTCVERRYRKHPIFAKLQKSIASARSVIEAEASSLRLARGTHVHTTRHFDRSHPLRRMSLHPSAPDYLPVVTREWKRIKVRELREIRRRNHVALRILKACSAAVERVLIRPDGTWLSP